MLTLVQKCDVDCRLILPHAFRNIVLVTHLYFNVVGFAGFISYEQVKTHRFCFNAGCYSVLRRQVGNLSMQNIKSSAMVKSSKLFAIGTSVFIIGADSIKIGEKHLLPIVRVKKITAHLKIRLRILSRFQTLCCGSVPLTRISAGYPHERAGTFVSLGTRPSIRSDTKHSSKVLNLNLFR